MSNTSAISSMATARSRGHDVRNCSISLPPSEELADYDLKWLQVQARNPRSLEE
jgi:hypothetical protein